jgi:hypothetical protein
LRGVDLNHRPLGYEPNELPDCSTPHVDDNQRCGRRQTSGFGNSAASFHLRVVLGPYAKFLDVPMVCCAQ